MKAYAEAAIENIQTTGHTVLPKLGKLALVLQKPKSFEHKCSAEVFSGGQGVQVLPKYKSTVVKGKWNKGFKMKIEVVVDAEKWDGPIAGVVMPKIPVDQEGLSKSQDGSVIIGKDGAIDDGGDESSTDSSFEKDDGSSGDDHVSH